MTDLSSAASWIAHRWKGVRRFSGFGYDPLFYLPEVRMTCAELPAHEKNARSHRGKALRQLATTISELLES